MSTQRHIGSASPVSWAQTVKSAEREILEKKSRKGFQSVESRLISITVVVDEEPLMRTSPPTDIEKLEMRPTSGRHSEEKKKSTCPVCHHEIFISRAPKDRCPGCNQLLHW